MSRVPDDRETAGTDRGPGIHVPPPIFFLTALAIAYFIQRAAPIPLLPPAWSVAREAAGVLVVVVGVAVTAWGMITFARARTAIVPMRPARTVVDAGPYRWSRNPMYLGLTVAYLGATLLLNSAWALVLLPLVIISITVVVIAREERYLRATFGTRYEEYTRRVRRWL